jgi:hypothetical protein
MTNATGKSDMDPTESETTRTVGNSSHGSREIPATSCSSMDRDRSGKTTGHNPDMHDAGKSDSSIVPGKSANNGGVPPSAESMEGRELTKENAGQLLLDGTQCPTSNGTPFVPRSRGLLGVRLAERGPLCRHASKVGAVCGSAARTDLRGGRPAMAVPTAIVRVRVRRNECQNAQPQAGGREKR